jgi:hypothetical protein
LVSIGSVLKKVGGSLADRRHEINGSGIPKIRDGENFGGNNG